MQVKDLNNFKISELEDAVVLSKLIDKCEKGIFKIKPFREMQYKQVIELKNVLRGQKNIDLVLIKTVSLFSDLQISDKDIEKANLKEFFQTINQINEQFEDIYRLEKSLQGYTDVDLSNAGADQMNQFGDLNVIDSLAGGDILKWKEVLQLDWWDVYNKLLKDKIEQDIQRRYAEIQKNKSK